MVLNNWIHDEDGSNMVQWVIWRDGCSGPVGPLNGAPGAQFLRKQSWGLEQRHGVVIAALSRASATGGMSVAPSSHQLFAILPC